MLRSTVTALCAIAVASSAQAVSISFVHIGSLGGPMNAAEDISGQLSLDVTEAPGGQVKFEFKNNVGIASSMMGIFFDADGSSLALPINVDNSPGTSFSAPASSPADLPGGGSIGFATTMNFSAGADNPPVNGIDNAGESVELTFSIVAGKSFADIIDEIMNRTIWIGVRVQAIGVLGASDAYVTGGNGTPVPLPAPALLGLAGLAPVALRRRR